MIVSVISSILLVIGIALAMGLTTEQVTDDFLHIIKPNDSLRQKAKNLRGAKKKNGLYFKIMSIKNALEATGKSKQFSVVCCAALILFGVGIIISLAINNVFLMPVLSVAFALLPFIYITNTLSFYEKTTKEGLETNLSSITTSYMRTDDIVTAVRENVSELRTPIKEMFEAFLVETSVINPNVKRALYNLKSKVDNEIFAEWCETLIQCQDDRTLKDTLPAIVAKFADVRKVNNDLKGILMEARNEYLVMVALVVGNVPLLYLLNKDWFKTLIYTVPGKACCGFCGIVILITALLMLKYTKPVEYKK